MGVLKSNRISTPDQVPFFRLKTVHLVVHPISKSVHSKLYMYSFRSIEVAHVQQKSIKVVQNCTCTAFLAQKLYMYKNKVFTKLYIFLVNMYMYNTKKGEQFGPCGSALVKHWIQCGSGGGSEPVPSARCSLLGAHVRSTPVSAS